MPKNYQTPKMEPAKSVPSRTPDMNPQTPTPESTGLDDSMFDLSETFQPIPTWEEHQAKRQAEQQAAAEAKLRTKARHEKQAEEAKYRAEKLLQKEAFHNTIKRVATKAAVGLLAVSLLTGAYASYEQDRGPENISEQPYAAEFDDSISSITVSGTPNVRQQPSVTDLDKSYNNSYGQAADGLTFSVNGIYLTDPTGDDNGQWIGISIEDATGSGLISESQAEEDKDGIVWMNNNSDNGISIITNKSEGNHE